MGCFTEWLSGAACSMHAYTCPPLDQTKTLPSLCCLWMLATAGLPSVCGTYPPCLECSADTTLGFVLLSGACVCVGKRATDAPK
jgi:hypothetical protein